MLGIKWLYKFLLKPIYGWLNELDSRTELASALPWLLNSPLWDEEFYLKNCLKAIQESQLSPVEHYLQIGWKMGFQPSVYFNGDAYLEKYTALHSNPLLHFLKHGRYEGCYGFFQNMYPALEGTLEHYRDVQKTRKAKHVVYTCVTNDYDDLNEISCPRYVAEDWDYVCFSDNPVLVERKTLGVWDVRPLVFTELDGTRNNRWHKMHPHILFPEYEDSLYIDANINFLTSYVFDCIQEWQADMIQPFHHNRDCLYHEAEWILKQGLDDELLKKQLQIFRAERFPEHFGLFENNILYRKHHQPEIAAMMEEWWGWIRDYCRRDQVSLMYVLWKHNRDVNALKCLNNSRVDYRNYCIFTHKKGM